MAGLFPAIFKSKIKRILSMKLRRKIATVIIILLSIAVNNINIKAEESNYITYNDIKYTVDTKSRTVSVCGYIGNQSDVEIPSMIYHNNAKGYIVSEIKDHAFDDCSTIKVLTIPDTIMKVGDMSFIGMDNLQAVVSKAEGINIIVKQNVKIVSDRSELGNVDMDSSNTSENNSNGVFYDNDSTDNTSGNNKIEDVKTVDSGEVIIDSDMNIIGDTSDGNVLNASKENASSINNETSTITSSNGIISDSGNKNTNNDIESSDKKNEINNKKSSTTKAVASIVCIILIAGLAVGLYIYKEKEEIG